VFLIDTFFGKSLSTATSLHSDELHFNRLDREFGTLDQNLPREWLPNGTIHRIQMTVGFE